jgi:hypothetical protein
MDHHWNIFSECTHTKDYGYVPCVSEIRKTVDVVVVVFTFWNILIIQCNGMAELTDIHVCYFIARNSILILEHHTLVLISLFKMLGTFRGLPHCPFVQ